ncbi:MAG: GNAT family N-acetyltransferase [Pseudomonadota bacterium]
MVTETRAMAGGPPVIDPLRFAVASHRTWPAAEILGETDPAGWILRFSEEAAGSRANSACVSRPVPDIAAAIAAAEAAYRARGRVPRFQLWPGQEAVDEALTARGYTAYDRSLLMVRAVAEPWEPDPPGCVAVEVRTPLAALEAVWEAGGVGPARQAVIARARVPVARFLGRVDMAPAGAVAAMVDGEIAVTQALWVDPACRGRGMARCLMGAVHGFAVQTGAAVMAHAVVADNASAIRLYEGLGFHAFGAYHYAKAPA